MEIKGRKVKIVFSDGENHFSMKEGVVVDLDNLFIYITNNGKDEVIPVSRIVRIEVFR